MSFHLVASVFEVTMVVYGVHASVLLNEAEVISVYISVNIEHSGLILTLSLDMVVTNMHHKLHVLFIAELLVMALPSVHLTHMWLSHTHWLSIALIHLRLTITLIHLRLTIAHLLLRLTIALIHLRLTITLIHLRLTIAHLLLRLSIAHTHWLSITHWLLVLNWHRFIVLSWLTICKHDLRSYVSTLWNWSEHFLSWMPLAFKVDISSFVTSVPDFEPLV